MKTLTELQDEQLIEKMGGDMCDLPLDSLRSSSIRKMWKAQCAPAKKKKLPKSIWSKAAQRAVGGRHKLYNSVDEKTQDDNLIDLMRDEMSLMLKAAKRGKWKEVYALYKELGRILN